MASKTQVFQKKDFYTPDPFFLLLQSLLSILSADELTDQKFDLINMGFSPDGKYFAAGQRGISFGAIGLTVENAALAYDVQARAPLSLKGNVKKLIAGGFAFTAADRLIAFNREKPDKSAVVSFPGGEIVEEFPMFSRKARFGDERQLSAGSAHFKSPRSAWWIWPNVRRSRAIKPALLTFTTRFLLLNG